MLAWQFFSALGGLSFTAPVALFIMLAMAARERLHLAACWCASIALAMLIVIASKVAFLGWGIGIRAIDFAGFSGHATRAAAIFPVIFFLLFQEERGRVLGSAVIAGIVLAALTAAGRVAVHAHSVSEAALGFALGTVAALVFINQAMHEPRVQLRPVLAGFCLAVLLLKPEGEPVDSEKWMVVLAMKLSGHDRPYMRWSWQPMRKPWRLHCQPGQEARGYLCYWPKGKD